jgi:hypothetical protein
MYIHAMRGRNLWVMLGVFTILGLFQAWTNVWAATPVTVTNPLATPVPVLGVEALNPYQVTESIGDSTTCPGSQCIMSFPAVPIGKRLVITCASAQLGTVSDVIVLEGSGVSFFVSKTQSNLSYLSVPVTVFYNAGSIPTARIFAPDKTLHTSLIVTLVGYLVPIK